MTQRPIYNEMNVAERIIDAVAAFDYPRDKHDIQVLDDSTDETSSVIAHCLDALPTGFLRTLLFLSTRKEILACFSCNFSPYHSALSYENALIEIYYTM